MTRGRHTHIVFYKSALESFNFDHVPCMPFDAFACEYLIDTLIDSFYAVSQCNSKMAFIILNNGHIDNKKPYKIAVHHHFITFIK